jgi:hypothetical protein
MAAIARRPSLCGEKAEFNALILEMKSCTALCPRIVSDST